MQSALLEQQEDEHQKLLEFQEEMRKAEEVRLQRQQEIDQGQNDVIQPRIPAPAVQVEEVKAEEVKDPDAQIPHNEIPGDEE